MVAGVSDGCAGYGRELGRRGGACRATGPVRLAPASAALGRARLRQARAGLAAGASRCRSGGRGRSGRAGRRCGNRRLRRDSGRETGRLGRSSGRPANYLRTRAGRRDGRRAARARGIAGDIAAGPSGLPGSLPALGPAAGAGLSGPPRSAATGPGAAQTRAAAGRDTGGVALRTLRRWRLPARTDPASTAGSPPRSGRDANTRRSRPRPRARRVRCGCTGADRASPCRPRRG